MRSGVTVVGGADEIDLAGIKRRNKAGKFAREDIDLALHALTDFIDEIDVEALDPAAQLRHRMRREGAVDTGDQWLVLRLDGHADGQRDRADARNQCMMHEIGAH